MLYPRFMKSLLLLTPLALVALAIMWPHFRGTALADSTGFKSPTFVHDPSEWTTPDRAFTDNGTFATETNGGDQQGYSEFGFSVPGGSFILGIAVQLNAWADPDLADCQIDVSLDGGGGFSGAKTAELDGDTGAVHTVGGSTDLWGEPWTSANFTDDNFVARVEYVDAGSCEGVALDHIQVNVYFKAPTDSGFHGPTTASTESGSDEWTDPNNAFTANNVYATSDQDDDDQGYEDFNLGVPVAAIITGVEVRAEALSEDNDGCQLRVRISGTGGFSNRQDAELGDTEEVLLYGGPEDDWGLGDLTPEDFTNANFALEIRNNDPDVGVDTVCDDGALTSVDVVQVKVYYKEFEQTGKSSPSATHAPNQWTDPEEAFISDDVDATEDTDGEEQGYSDFGLSIPIDSLIVGIEVQVDAASADDDGTCRLDVALSWDGGATYTPSESFELDAGAVHTVGGLEELWDHVWSVAELSDENFVVKLKNIDTGAGCAPPTTGVDFLQVNVYYKDLVEEGFSPPSAAHAPNDFATPENAFTNNDVDATSTASGEEQGYANFGLTIPNGSIITGIEVLVEAASSDSEGCQLDVNLSWDDGDTTTIDTHTADLTNVQTPAQILGGSADTWGRDWIAADFANGKFVVIVTNVDPGAECDADSDVLLDYLEVNVYWKTEAEPPTNTPTNTSPPTATNTTGPPPATSTPLATDTPTITATPTITDTPTNTNTPTITNTPTNTNTPTRTNTPVNTNTPTNTPTLTKDVGDVNDDGLVNAIDALLILQYNAGLITTLPNAASADVNLNGVINAVDAALILQFSAHLLGGLPPQ